MATRQQTEATKKNIKKAQKAWQQMSPREHALAQPQGRDREKPGVVGEGNYYRVAVRPKEQFTTFRYHDVGEKDGDLQRLAGQRQNGSWDTQAWLINKKSAHIEGDRLIPDTADVEKLLAKLGSEPKHIKGDIFEAKDRPNVPERVKPTQAQQTAYLHNIRLDKTCPKGQEKGWIKG